MRLAIAVAAVTCIFQHSPAIAGELVCYTYYSSGYCQYGGRVREAYINARQQIILYFDTPLDTGSAASVGLIGVAETTSAIFNMQSNPELGKSLFAAMLAAPARGATVSV